jgi:thiosulfate/3-mercaptopyruvate sulfurtransferase
MSRLVDMRSAANAYPAGHVPGAVYLSPVAIRVADRPPTFLPTPQEFEALMAKLGIDNATRVVVYDERGGIYAARLWWILNYFGHANVALMNGGWVKMDGGAANGGAGRAGAGGRALHPRGLSRDGLRRRRTW